MAFNIAGLNLVGGSKAGNAPQIWTYKTADTAATMNTVGYFDNGTTTNTGMRTLMFVGDVIFAYDTTTPAATILYVNQVSAAGIIDVNDGTTLAATDTD
jgi:hypothetical protein